MTSTKNPTSFSGGSVKEKYNGKKIQKRVVKTQYVDYDWFCVCDIWFYFL